MKETSNPHPCPFPKDAHEAVEIAHLIEFSPESRWVTPAELGERYGYSEKHVIRLVMDERNHIAARLINGRWHIFECAFMHYLDRRRQR